MPKARRALVFNQQLYLYAPEYLVSELNEHLQSDEEMKEKLQQTKEETDTITRELLHRIQIIPITEYSSFIKKAIEISPDEFDAPYFALSLRLKLPLWSNDKKLKKQGEVKVFNTSELLQFLNE